VLQRTLRGPSDIFVSKLNAAGSALEYSTYIGGSGDELTRGIALDSARNVYVTGQTSSADFPTTAGAIRISLAGTTDSFVTQLDANGSTLPFSTYLGGSGDELGRDIAVDEARSVYVVGVTSSPDFPTTMGALRATFGGVNDGFIAKFTD